MKDFFQHFWDSGHVILAHFPIALLTFACIFTCLGYLGKITNKQSLKNLYSHALPLQVIGALFIYPTMLFGERDYDSLGNQTLEDLASNHESFGSITTYYYIAITLLVLITTLYHRFRNNQLDKSSKLHVYTNKVFTIFQSNKLLSKVVSTKDKILVSTHPLQTFAWVVLSIIGLALLLYTGYLGGQLVHEHGILVN